MSDSPSLDVPSRSVPSQDDYARGVLVVDDEEAIRTSIAMLLEDEGYTVFRASNGAEALELLQATDEPLVVLLDWMMPILNGLEVLEAVRRNPARLGRHAYIFMSAAFPAGLREAAAHLHTIRLSVLIKPFTVELVLDKVAEARASLTHGGPRPHSDADKPAG